MIIFEDYIDNNADREENKFSEDIVSDKETKIIYDFPESLSDRIYTDDFDIYLCFEMNPKTKIDDFINKISLKVKDLFDNHPRVINHSDVAIVTGSVPYLFQKFLHQPNDEFSEARETPRYYVFSGNIALNVDLDNCISAMNFLYFIMSALNKFNNALTDCYITYKNSNREYMWEKINNRFFYMFDWFLLEYQKDPKNAFFEIEGQIDLIRHIIKKPDMNIEPFASEIYRWS